MFGQISIPCYLGNEMILKHESLTGCIFDCGWHLRSPQYGMIVIILMEMAKRQLQFLVANWIVLDLELFKAVSQSIRLFMV